MRIGKNSPGENRDPNLDLLRASAILMVVLFHIAQRFDIAIPLRSILFFGAHGVDLFFVLSGWLIGGLLWREEKAFGNVRLGRFVARRALRTIPPYFAALTISYLGVKFARGESFDWRYLFFLQNYLQQMPYFKISWSLCVEEHFYVLMPFIVLPLVRLSKELGYRLILAAAFFPVAFRALETGFNSVQSYQFGYYTTATHLHFEGLLFGVWASLVRSRDEKSWSVIRTLARWLFIPVVLLFSIVQLSSESWKYALTPLVVSVLFLSLLISIVERPAVPLANSHYVFVIASTSYSAYLIHAVVIEAVMVLLGRFNLTPFFQAGLILIAIFLAADIFYRLIEVPSMNARKQLMPVRS